MEERSLSEFVCGIRGRLEELYGPDSLTLKLVFFCEMEFLKTVIQDPWVCGTAWVREWVRRGARSTGRDNDPDGLGYMPDSQGPQYGSKPTLTGAGVSGPRISPSDVFSPWHKSRERNYQCPLGALIIPLPHVFPPTYVGFGISYILGNLIKAKINVP